MASKAETMATNVVGKRVKPKYPDHVGNAHGSWPVNDPDTTRSHQADVLAAYMKDGALAIVCATCVNRITFETFLVNVDLV